MAITSYYQFFERYFYGIVIANTSYLNTYICNRLSAEHLHRLYIFSLVWGIGAFLENDDRRQYDEFLRNKFTSYDFPEPFDINVSVLDFYVNIEGEYFCNKIMIISRARGTTTTGESKKILPLSFFKVFVLKFFVNCYLWGSYRL